MYNDPYTRLGTWNLSIKFCICCLKWCHIVVKLQLKVMERFVIFVPSLPQLTILCPRTEKSLPLRKAKEAWATVNRQKGRERERERDNNILFNNLWVFDIFVLLPAIASCNNDSVCIIQFNMPWEFGFPLSISVRKYIHQTWSSP